MLRVYIPRDRCATAATLSPTLIARSALTACGLVLTAAPISPRAGAVSKTSALIPRAFSAFAAASPASPPPTIAILQLADIRYSAATVVGRSSIDRDPCCLHDSGPELLLLRQIGSQSLRRMRPRGGADLRERLLDFVAGQRAAHGVAQLLPDCEVRARRRDHEIDRGGDELIESALHHGGKLGCQRTAGFAGHGQPAQAAVADVRQQLGQG